MWKKIAIGGAIAAAAVGSGTAALAVSDSTTSGTPTFTSATAANATRPLPQAARRALHGTWVTRNRTGDGTFVTHDAIRGQVTAVSTSAITVKAADGTSQTYVVNTATKVRQRTNGKGAPSTIGAVKVGDSALVAGTGTTTLTATAIIDVPK
jgi:hypothetical protein